jgi:hypothetical protein
MKKILALLVITGVVQGLYSSQQPIQYKYLNRLNSNSELRKKCEEVDRAWFVKGKTEKACDNLDNAYLLYTQVMGNLKEHKPGTISIVWWDKIIGPSGKRGEMPSNLKDVASIEMDNRCSSEVRYMFPDMNIEDRKKETVYLSTLTNEIRREEFAKFEQVMIAQVKK